MHCHHHEQTLVCFLFFYTTTVYTFPISPNQPYISISWKDQCYEPSVLSVFCGENAHVVILLPGSSSTLALQLQAKSVDVNGQQNKNDLHILLMWSLMFSLKHLQTGHNNNWRCIQNNLSSFLLEFVEKINLEVSEKNHWTRHFSSETTEIFLRRWHLKKLHTLKQILL